MLKIRVHEKLDEAFNPKTVKIGNQTWMAENLAIDDGGLGIKPLNNDDDFYLYNLSAAQRIVKTLPGWHLPTLSEFETLFTELGGKREEHSHFYEYVGVDAFNPPFNLKPYNAFKPILWTSTKLPDSLQYATYEIGRISAWYGSSPSTFAAIRLIKD